MNRHTLGSFLLASFLLAATCAGQVGPASPLANYRLDGDFLDATTNHFDGAVKGPVPTSDRSGSANKAMSFDGGNDLISCGNQAAFNFTSSFSVQVWVKMTEAQPAKIFVAKYPSAYAALSFGVGTDLDSRATGFIIGASGAVFQTSGGGPILSDGVWHCVTYVYDKTFGIRLFVDSNLAASLAAPGIAINNSAPLTMGGLTFSSQLQSKASFDNIKIFDRALTVDEVVASLPIGSTGPASPLADYPLDGGFQDVGPNHFDGTGGGRPSSTSDRFGTASKAMSFDGAADVVDCGNQAAFNFTGSFSMQAWVKLTDAQPGKIFVGKYPSAYAPLSFGFGTDYQSRPTGFIINETGGQGGVFQVSGGPVLTDGLWHCVTYVYDRSFGIRIYADGELAGSLSTPAITVNNTAPLTIGGLTFGGLDFKGSIDDVKIFNRVLTAEEIAASQANTLPSTKDLWDISNGSVVTSESATYPETSPGMFGGAGYADETGRTIFSDNPPAGATQYIEWKTVGPVAVGTVRLFAGGGSGSTSRGFSNFVLKAKSLGSTNFDQTLISQPFSDPFSYLDPGSYLAYEGAFPTVIAQEFRAEFVKVGLGSRIMELDAFGPETNTAPDIAFQPHDAERYIGRSVIFSVAATGAEPLSYQWQRAGTNLVESSRFVGVNSWALRINNLTAEDAGVYSVIVTNPLDSVTSSNALLAVTADTTPPVITMLSPLSGTNTEQAFALSGMISDNDVVASARWERNGAPMGALTLTNGNFYVQGLKFLADENRIRVIAKDSAGNESTNDTVVTWSPARAIILNSPASQQEGGLISVPISLVTTGGLSGATFAVSFDTNYLTEPHFEWADDSTSGLTSLNLESNKVFRASFALGGSTLDAGSRTLATMSFRTRSVKTNTTINFLPTLVGFYAETGNPFTNGNYVQSTTTLITKRKVIGDNNANDRLDVGDASIILRLVTGLDPTRSWDVAGNDLNSTLTIDSGDVIKVLRAVVGIDPQPTIPAAPAGALRAFGIGAAGTPIQVVADKTTAAAGEKVTVDVRLADQTKSLTGISFRMEYPADALRLENASSQIVGPIVPTGALTAWNVSPNQNNYATQNGAVSLAASSPTTWASSNGIVARLTFTVQAGATSRFGWPVTVKNVEVSRPDFQIETMPANQWTFIARAPEPAQFTSDISFNGSTPRLTLQGDLGATYLIEGSSDLKAWDPIGVYYDANGALTIEDPAGAGAAARYYRATLQQ